MTKDKKVYSIDDLLDLVKTYIKNEDDINEIKEAYLFAKDVHDGETRLNNDPKITHPLNVAVILAGINSDKETIIAGLLHEVMDDGVTKEEIETKFGVNVAKLVSSVYQIGKINYSTDNDYLVEYYKKIIVGISEDARAIVIKLASRLHNLKTLYAMPREKQIRIANETVQILSPIAEHLGIYKIKSELEDLSLRYLKPDVYYDISKNLNNTKLERDNAVLNMIKEVSNLLSEHNIKHEIMGRSKSIFSIYKKLDKGKKFSDIFDFLALRVLVETEQDCYVVLGLIHSKYKPVPNRFKDYVANPKTNGYQSLHTTVFGEDANLFEIQIRTHEMDAVAENGVAAHWAYKEHIDANQVLKNTTDQKLQFFKSVMELNNDINNPDIASEIEEQVFDQSIYVYTPKGDVFELPKGSTPIDFAYKIHSKVGETMIGATVNDKMVPLDYELQTNDIVRIMTNKNSTPSMEWINLCKSSQTKAKIKAYFIKSEKEVYIERGKEALEKELRRRKIPYNDFFTDDNRKILYKELKVEDDDELFLSVGNGKNTVGGVVNIIFKPEEKEEPKKFKEQKVADASVIVEGIDNIKVNLSNCCNPVPGDDIIGYITKGNGITVHRVECHNVANLDERLVSVSWNIKPTNKKFVASLMIYTNTRENKILDIIQKINLFDIQVENVQTRSKGDANVYQIDIYVRDKDSVDKLLLSLNKISYIDSVERVMN